MKKLFVPLLLLLASVAVAQTRDFTRWVNPFIGTGGHGHTFPGATLPFGMVQLSPDTRVDNWDGSSGYHYSDDIIYGFSHTHLSGTGIPDGCDILFMPTVSEYEGPRTAEANSFGLYPSKFLHSDEVAEPGYYSVKLDDRKIYAEMTATSRVGFHRYTFPTSRKGGVSLNLNWRDRLLDGDFKIFGKKRIEGYRQSSSWAKNQTVYFVAEFSRSFDEIALGSTGDKLRNAFFAFSPKHGEQILLKVAISYVSIEGARKNLEVELPGWDFDKVRADAKAEWNKGLSKIEVSCGTDDQTTTFYTALYHTMIHPNVFNDVDGSYLGHDRKVHQLPSSSAAPLGVRRSSASPRDPNKVLSGSAAAEGRRSRELLLTERKSRAFPHTEGQSPRRNETSPRPPVSASPRREEIQYSVFSLWDTFRAAHPLYTIIDQKRTVDFINTFIRIYEQGGRLPVWELWGEETDTMIGYHAVSVIADAMAKGIKGFDYEKAYKAAKHSAELDHFGLAAYKKRGYISTEDENESVSKTLEYAYDDWCIAQMQKALDGRGDITEIPRAFKEPQFWQRAGNFQNLYNPRRDFFVPRRNGDFVRPFAPNEVTFSFTEGNSWQYSFFVPHDIDRLIELYGGRAQFAGKLVKLFTTDQKLAGREQADLTGLIGQYAHGNEPSHHIPYLFNYAGVPWRTQMYVRKIMDEFYKNSPDGLIGNEDCGQMSAWYVLSASGFYPVTPGSPEYALGTPLFPEVTYRLENGKTFIVRARDLSDKNFYVRSVKLNQSVLRSPFIKHTDVMNGGVLEFEMTDAEVATAFDEPTARRLPRMISVAAPWIAISPTTIFMGTATQEAKIFYTTDGTEPSDRSTPYVFPFRLKPDTGVTIIKAIAIDAQGNRAFVETAKIHKRPNNWTVQIASPYSTQYTGGGDDAIVDGLRGTTNFTSGEWQGYQGKTFEAVIDLQKQTEIKSVGGSFLQFVTAWIWMPGRIEFETSTDGVNFTRVAEIKPGFPQQEMNTATKEFRQSIAPVSARYVRVRAFNFGKIPAWHPGAGGDPWIFVDEILID